MKIHSIEEHDALTSCFVLHLFSLKRSYTNVHIYLASDQRSCPLNNLNQGILFSTDAGASGVGPLGEWSFHYAPRVSIDSVAPKDI